MSSQRRIDSSRANGALSTGHITPDGRERSQAAPTTHGLAARRVVLENESEEEFLALREAFLHEIRPATPIEFRLFEQYVAACWRLDRLANIETALLDLEITRQQPQVDREFAACDGYTRTALAFRSLCSDESKALAAVNRYEARYRRTCDRTLKSLAARRENRKSHQAPNPKNGH